MIAPLSPWQRQALRSIRAFWARSAPGVVVLFHSGLIMHSQPQLRRFEAVRLLRDLARRGYIRAHDPGQQDIWEVVD